MGFSMVSMGFLGSKKVVWGGFRRLNTFLEAIGSLATGQKGKPLKTLGCVCPCYQFWDF